MLGYKEKHSALLRAMRVLKVRRGRGQEIGQEVTIGATTLQQGDRLSPCAGLRNTFALKDQALPIDLALWRPRYSARSCCLDSVIHRNPLFCLEGSSPDEILAIYSLHTVYYGPIIRWTSAVVWRIILQNHWNHSGTIEAIIDSAVKSLKKNLFYWFDRENISHERRLGDLTLSMLGPRLGFEVRGERQHVGCLMKVKAAESGTLFEWARYLLAEKGKMLPFL